MYQGHLMWCSAYSRSSVSSRQIGAKNSALEIGMVRKDGTWVVSQAAQAGERLWGEGELPQVSKTLMWAGRAGQLGPRGRSSGHEARHRRGRRPLPPGPDTAAGPDLLPWPSPAGSRLAKATGFGDNAPGATFLYQGQLQSSPLALTPLSGGLWSFPAPLGACFPFFQVKEGRQDTHQVSGPSVGSKDQKKQGHRHGLSRLGCRERGQGCELRHQTDLGSYVLALLAV